MRQVSPAKASGVVATIGLGCLLATSAGACIGGPVFTVDSTTDAVDASPGDGVCASSAGECTLRAAIQESNALPGGNIIILPQAPYVLTLPEPAGGGIAGGDLDVTDTLRIRASGFTHPVIRAGGEFRVLDLHAGFIQLDSLILEDGDADEGGGMRIDEAALVWGRYLAIRDNVSFNRGGGILNRGRLVLWSARITGNQTAARGGGLRASTQAVTTLWNTTISGNGANVGGGIHSQGTTNVFNTTVSGDSAAAGGGGIFNGGTMTLANATVASNGAYTSGSGRPGGVWSHPDGVLVIRNSIIADNVNLSNGEHDCSGTLASQGYNLIEDASTCTITGTTTGNILGVDPELGPLQVNVQGTPTHGYEPGAPAHNAGNPSTPGSGPPACWAEDQRESGRSGCDIGAYDRP